jgi:hypothetical protein
MIGIMSGKEGSLGAACHTLIEALMAGKLGLLLK